MIQRRFHTIGQGAFYSEIHEDFNIVYDCGNWRNTKLSDKIVAKSFNSGEQIDILFISHFDYDHVNKIDKLKSNFKIKRVVLPLLQKDEETILINIYNNLNFTNISNLILSPEEYFGQDTVIIKVERSKEKFEEKDITTLDLESLENRNIKSGSILTFKNWIFIPYNFEYKKRRQELENEFNKLGLDFNKFKKNQNYLINNRSSIKKAYENLSGSINQNSMLLYSGPNEINNSRNHYRYYSNYYPSYQFIEDFIFLRSCDNKIGCIYTGDADLNKTRIDNIYSRYWKIVGTIQIPHHGDQNSFNKNIFKKQNHLFCPISYGTNNTYGHPSIQVISDILNSNCQPISVTEKADTFFIEVIK